MKKIFFLLLILIATTSQAQVSLGGYIQTLNGSPYPTHIDSLGKGGYVVVRDTIQRNAIVCLRRKYGMAVYVQDTGRIYILKDSNCLNTWVEFSGGSGGVSKITAGTNVTITPTTGLGDVTINAASGTSDTTYTPIDLKGGGDYPLPRGNAYYNIRVGSDTTDPVDPGFLIFPNPNAFVGQRITIVNNDTVYKFPAYISQSGYVPLLEGTNNLVTCIPYGLTYEFVSMNGYWYATTLKQRETRANLVVGTIGIATEPYDLNSTNAIYQFTSFIDKYGNPIIGTINFPPAYYINGEDTIPINDGQRITIVNNQFNYEIAIGKNKPYKTFFYYFEAPVDYGVLDTIPPQVAYEFVSVGGHWILTTPIFMPEHPVADATSADYHIKTHGIYDFEGAVFDIYLPEQPKFFSGETIIIHNSAPLIGGSNLNIRTVIGGYNTLPPGSTITIMSIGTNWVTTSVYP